MSLISINVSSCRWIYNTRDNQNQNSRVTPTVTPSRELNEKRLPSMTFREWHRSKPGMIANNMEKGYFYLETPGGKLVPFNEYEINEYPSDTRTNLSHSGKYQVETVRYNERTRSGGCCAIQEFDYMVNISEVENPYNITKIADANWKFYEWSPDDNFILFSVNEDLFLIDSRTKERIDVMPSSGLKRFEFTPDAKGLFLFEYRDNLTQLQYFDLAARKLETLFSGGESPVDMKVSTDSKKLGIFTAAVNNDAAPNKINHLRLFDVNSKASIGSYDLPGGELLLYKGWQSNGREFGFTVSGENYAHDMYSINVENGKISHWYPPEGETTGLYK